MSYLENAKHAAWALSFAVATTAAGSANATIVGYQDQQTCWSVYVQTGEDCTADNCMGPAGCLISCTPQYGYQTQCADGQVPIEGIAGIIPVYGAFNGTQHLYSTSNTSWPPGFTSQGEIFSLASDSYGGAVPFSDSEFTGQGYIYTSQAASNVQALYLFANPETGDALFTLDPNGNSGYPCNVYYDPSQGRTILDCYMYGPQTLGYVGPPV